MTIQKLNVFRCAYHNSGISGDRRIIYLAAIRNIINNGWWSEYWYWSDRQWRDAEFRDLPPDSDLLAEIRQHDRERNVR